MATPYERQPPPCLDGGTSLAGGPTLMLPPPANYLPVLYAFAAADSSCDAIPLTFFGFFRKSWNSLNSPWPTVPPNVDGSRSDMSKRVTFALARATAILRVNASG